MQAARAAILGQLIACRSALARIWTRRPPFAASSNSATRARAATADQRTSSKSFGKENILSDFKQLADIHSEGPGNRI